MKAHKKYKWIKKRLSHVLRVLRVVGYGSRQGQDCCQSCAVSAVETKKYVLYSRQDEDDLFADAACFLSWSGKLDLIIDVLKNSGLRVLKPKDTKHRIWISYPGPVIK